MSDGDSLYELLGLEGLDATDKDIKRAFRLKALTCHPDKVGPDDTEAGARFHALSVAAETLSDPEKRKAYDATLKATLVAKQRTKAMDAQRRAARDALIARESSASLATNKEALARKWLTMEKLRDEERARMEALETHAQRTAELIAKSVPEQKADETTHSTQPIEVYALRVKWKHDEVSQHELETIFGAFGTLDRVLISSKGKKSALLVYSDVAVAKTVLNAQKTLPLFTVTWATPKGSKPSASSSSKTGTPSYTLNVPKSVPVAPSLTRPSPPLQRPMTAVELDDYEAQTLKRMMARMSGQSQNQQGTTSQKDHSSLSNP